MIDRNDAKEFIAETEEIIENLEGIKGEMYTNGLLLVLNVINMTKMTASMLRDRVTDAESERLATLTGTVITDTIMRVTTLLCPSAEGKAYDILCRALSKDVRILVDKQDEYTIKVPE